MINLSTIKACREVTCEVCRHTYRATRLKEIETCIGSLIPNLDYCDTFLLFMSACPKCHMPNCRAEFSLS